MAYVALARGNEKDAATRFDRALQADAGVRAGADRPRPGAARARSRRRRARQLRGGAGEGPVADRPAQPRRRAALPRDPGHARRAPRRPPMRGDGTRPRRSIGRRSPRRRIRRFSIAIWRRSSSGPGQTAECARALPQGRRARSERCAVAAPALRAILESQGDVVGALAAYERARAIDPAEVPGAAHGAAARRRRAGQAAGGVSRHSGERRR